MNDLLHRVLWGMMAYEAGCPQRIQHFLKVYAYANFIGEEESLDSDLQLTLELAALLHDIGIWPSLQKYNSASGRDQEREGPPAARKLLHACVPDMEEERVERLCYLIGHHHTYQNIDDLDYQILVEADFLVNFQEGENERERIHHVRDTLFKTDAGTRFVETMFALEKKEPAPSCV